MLAIHSRGATRSFQPQAHCVVLAVPDCPSDPTRRLVARHEDDGNDGGSSSSSGFIFTEKRRAITTDEAWQDVSVQWAHGQDHFLPSSIYNPPSLMKPEPAALSYEPAHTP